MALRDSGWGKPKEEVEVSNKVEDAIPIKAEVLERHGIVILLKVVLTSTFVTMNYLCRNFLEVTLVLWK